MNNDDNNRTRPPRHRSDRGDRRPYRDNRDRGDRNDRNRNETREVTSPVLDDNGEVIGSVTANVPNTYEATSNFSPTAAVVEPGFVPPQDDDTDYDDSASRENKPVLYVRDLKAKQAEELVELAKEAGVEGSNFMLKQELIFSILKVMAEANQGIIVVEGVLEIMPDGFGFLRSKEYNYRAGPDDVYVSPNQIKRFALRTGDTIEGEVRAPKARERYFALAHIIKVGDEELNNRSRKTNFDNLIPVYPDEKINMELKDSIDTYES